MHGGSAWDVGGKSISFTQGTKALYDGNSTNAAMTTFAAGTATATADPNNPYYIFKIVNGVNPSDIYCGVIQILSAVPSASVSTDYRI